jgi:hypothetical protein
MEANAKNMGEILKTLAIHQAADRAAHGVQHGSRIARIEVGSWQAEIIRASSEIRSALDSDTLRALMGDRNIAVIFLPQEALVTAEIIDRICYESPFNKMIIWESA